MINCYFSSFYINKNFKVLAKCCRRVGWFRSNLDDIPQKECFLTEGLYYKQGQMNMSKYLNLKTLICHFNIEGLHLKYLSYEPRYEKTNILVSDLV